MHGTTRSGAPLRQRTDRDPLARAGVALFFLGVATIPALALRFGGVTFSDACLAVSGSLLLLRLAASHDSSQRRSRRSAWVIAAWCTAVGAALSAFRTHNVVGHLGIEARILFILLALPWLAHWMLNSERSVRLSIYAYLWGAGASGLVAILQTKVAIFTPPGGLLAGRAFGLTQHPNDAGASLALAVVLAAGLIIYEGARRHRLTLVLGLFAGVGLILSGSVTGMLATLFGLAVLMVRRAKRVRAVVKVALVLLSIYGIGIALQSGPGLNLSPIERLRQSTSTSRSSGLNTLASRQETNEFAWRGIVANPLVGRGLDPDSGVVVDGLAPHNFPLLVWYQGGAMFLLGILIAVGTALRRGWRRHGGAGREAVFAGAIAMCVFSMTAPILVQRHFWLPLILMLAYSGTPRLTERGWTSPSAFETPGRRTPKPAFQ